MLFKCLLDENKATTRFTFSYRTIALNYILKYQIRKMLKSAKSFGVKLHHRCLIRFYIRICKSTLQFSPSKIDVHERFPRYIFSVTSCWFKHQTLLFLPHTLVTISKNFFFLHGFVLLASYRKRLYYQQWQRYVEDRELYSHSRLPTISHSLVSIVTLLEICNQEWLEGNLQDL